MSSPFSDEEIQRINADVWGGAEDLERDRTKLRTYVNVQAKDPAPQRAEALQIQRRTGVPWSLSEIDMDEARARDAYQQLGPVRVENSPAWGTFLKGPLAPIALKNPEKTRAIADAIDWRTVGTPQQGLVGASIDRGMHMTTVGQLGTRVYMGIASDADVLKFHEMRHNWPVVPDSPGYFDDAASMVVEQGPVLASIATYAATGGAAAGLVGLGSGPGAAAFAAGGAWTGAGYGSFVLEGGLAYAELLDVADEIHRTSGETIPHEAVVGASMLVGFLNAGLEMGAVGALLRITGLSRLRGNLTGEAATEIIKSKTLRPYLVSFAKRMGKAMAVEGGQEMGQESVNMVAATILVESTTSQTRDILTEENVKRLLHAGAAGALVGGSIQVAASPIVAASQRVGMNKATLAHAKRLDTITAARLDDGGLADADPEGTREWIQGQLDEGGGDTNLYIPAGVLAELFQDDEGLSDAVHSIPEVADQLSEVLIAANADVVIPISDYATYLAAHHEKLKGLLHHGLGERNTTEVEANAAEDEANLRTELAALAGVDEDGQPLDLELSGDAGRAEALEQSLIEKLVRTASASPEAAARLADLIKQHAERRASDPAVGERAFEEADIDIKGPLDEQAAAGGLGQPVDLESMLNDLRGTPTPRAEATPESAELAAMLDQLGFDLEQMTNEEVIEALGDRFAATTLNQPAGDDRLVVQHNLTEKNLLHAETLGGIPMPSIAISKADTPLAGFGEITLLGTEEMARPSAKNPVFAADAYTSRYPNVKTMLAKGDSSRLNAYLGEPFGVDAVWKIPRDSAAGDGPSGRGEPFVYLDVESDLEDRGLEDFLNHDAVQARFLWDLDEMPSIEEHPKALNWRKEVRKRVNARAEEFELWKEGFLAKAGITPTRKMFLGFTDMGNRRYKAETLENVVREMKREMRGAEGGASTFGAGSLRAHLAPKLKSLKEIKANRDKISSKKETDKFKSEMNDMLSDLAHRLPAEKFDNPFFRTDVVIERMADVARGGRWDEWFPTASPELRAEVEAFFDLLREGTTEYFEIKPKRGVAISEFAVALVPDGVSDETVRVLEGNGVEVRKYSTEEQRVSLVKGQTNVLFQPAGEGVRGSLTYNNELTTAIMRFTKAKNLSTGLHEAGHLFFAMMLKDARTEGIDPKLLEDMQTAIDYLGMDSLESLLQDSQGNLTEEAVAAHEKWADSFVAYLREGKAPSAALRASFSRFKSWLLNLYKTMRGLNVELTPEIREVFDRLLASDEQVTQAKQQDRMMPVFESAEAAEMTPAQFAAYQKSYERIDTKAQEELGKKVMRELDRELTAEWKENWEKVQAQVEAEINADPIVQLRHLLQFKTPLNEEEPEGPAPMRLDLDTIKESYGGKSTVKALGGTGSYSMVQKDGIHPELLAPQFGFESGQEVVDALVATTNRKLSIKIETDKRMKATYGDILNDGTLSELAIDALENDEKGNFLIRQQRILGHRAGIANNIPQAIARDVAREVVQNKQIRSLRPDLYRNAEARAAREALDAVAAGDWQAAHEAGRKQLLNHFLAVAAVKAKEQTTKWHGYTKTFDKKAKRERLARAGEDYLEQIDSLLGRFDLRQMSNKKADLALADWVQARKDAAKAENEASGGELIAEPAFVINDEMLDREFSKHWRTMTVSEMGGLVDALKNIEHLAMSELKLLLEQDKLDFETRVEQFVETAEAHRRTDKPISIETRNQIAEQDRLSVGAYFASHRKLASLVAEMDGGYGGVLFDMIIRPMDEAGTIEGEMKIEAGTRLGELFAPYMGVTKMERAGKRAQRSLDAVTRGRAGAVEMAQKKKVPGTGPNVKPMSKIARLMAVLNMGNAGNLQRLTDGHGWSQSDALAILNTLTKEDMDFVQGVWDYFEELWPEVAELQRKISGVAPKKIQRQAIETRHGTYAGGYFPIADDSEQGPKAWQDSVANAANDMMRSPYGKAKTQDSFTKHRAAKVVGQKLRLDFGVIFSHVGDVVHRLAWQEWLIDTGRLLADKRIAGAIMQGYGSPVYRTMIMAHKDIAAGDRPAEIGWEQFINWMRKGSSIAGMGLSITTAMYQPLGITQSARRIGSKWVGVGIKKWLRGPEEMESTVEWIHSLSKMMKHRSNVQTSDMNREIREVQSDLTEGGVLSPASKSYFYMIVKSQQMVDIPTWLGAYEKEMEVGSGDESRAVAMADRAVIDAQGGGQIKDLAAIQRGGPLMKMWTNFYSFFNTTWNNTAESYRMNDFAKPADFGKFLADMLWLYTIPALLSEAMMDTLMDRWDEDESWAEWIFWGHAGYALNMLVGPRELSGAASGYADWDGPAGVRGFAAANAVGKQIGQGDADAALFKSMVHFVGIFGHLPSVAFMRAVEGGEALIEGETKNPAALLLGAPKEKR